MTYRSGELTKLEYGSIVAASLAQLMLRQRDAVGLAVFSDQVNRYLPPRGVASHYSQMLEELLAPPTAPKTDLAATFHELAEQIKRRGLIIVISDLFGPIEETLMGLRHFRHRKHEVIVFHILDRHELEFPFDDLTRFDGLEGEPDMLVDPHTIRANYLREFQGFLQALQRGCREMDVDLVRMPTDQPVEQLLSAYLAARMRPGAARREGA
jgi:uncharacterized protein (DUF58 family)